MKKIVVEEPLIGRLEWRLSKKMSATLADEIDASQKPTKFSSEKEIQSILRKVMYLTQGAMFSGPVKKEILRELKRSLVKSAFDARHKIRRAREMKSMLFGNDDICDARCDRNSK